MKKIIFKIKVRQLTNWIESLRMSDKDILVKTLALLVSLFIIIGIGIYVSILNLVIVERTDLYLRSYYYIFNYKEVCISIFKAAIISAAYLASGISWGFYAIMMILRGNVDATANLETGFTWFEDYHSKGPCWNNLRVEEFSEEDRKDMTFY